MDSAFPGNSHRAGEPSSTPEEPAHESLVEGARVIRRKKPLGRRLRETFFAADAETVIGFVVADVIVPTLKALVRDSFNEAIDRAFNGTNRGRTTFASTVKQAPVGYDRFSRPTGVTTVVSNGQTMARKPADPRDAMDIGEIIVEHRHVAEAILQSLFEDVQQYNRATVGALYQLLGQTPVFTDHKFGWRNLDNADIKRTSGGYLLLLPPVESLR